MELLLIILVVVILFGGGGWGYSRYRTVNTQVVNGTPQTVIVAD